MWGSKWGFKRCCRVGTDWPSSTPSCTPPGVAFDVSFIGDSAGSVVELTCHSTTNCFIYLLRFSFGQATTGDTAYSRRSRTRRKHAAPRRRKERETRKEKSEDNRRRRARERAKGGKKRNNAKERQRTGEAGKQKNARKGYTFVRQYFSWGEARIEWGVTTGNVDCYQWVRRFQAQGANHKRPHSDENGKRPAILLFERRNHYLQEETK